MGLTSACLLLLLGQRPWCEACITAPEARALIPGKGCLASLSLPHAPSVQTPRAYSVLSLSCSMRTSPVPPSHRTIAQASVGTRGELRLQVAVLQAALRLRAKVPKAGAGWAVG